MKKTIIAILALALLLAAAAQATGAPQFSSALFDSGKAAMGFLASGEYERLVTLLPFSDIAPGASEWERFARNYDLDGAPKHPKAVAYVKGGAWVIAVGMQDGDDPEALMLISEDGSTLTGYRYAEWSQVEQECEASGEVIR